MNALAVTVAVVIVLGAGVDITAQGGRGRGGPPAPPGRAGAPVDLTGTWVSVITEDWQWRMRTPVKGDTTSVPLNGQGVTVASSWEPSMDGRCEAYGVGGIMRMPTRLKISWQDDLTLKIETDAGQQTRLLQFAKPGAPPVSGAATSRTLQGTSVAEWQRSGGAFDAFLERGAGACASAVGSAQGHHNQHAAWLAAAKWCALQSERADHRVLQQGDKSAGRRVVRGHDGGRRPDLSRADVRHELELQERAERFQVESNAV
jgi:hypothetical protein